jgi:hypothetical protein
MSFEFEWDPKKAKAKKHGVTFKEGTFDRAACGCTLSHQAPNETI